MRNFQSLLLVCASTLVLSACGADSIASPGAGGNVTINNPPAPAPVPTPTPTSTLITPAAGCPTISDPQGLTDGGTISGPTGTYRVCRLPSVVRVSSTLPKVAGLLYELNGRVNVGCDGGFTAPTAAAPLTTPLTVGCTGTQTSDTNVTLTFAAGTITYGATGQSWLAVNRGNRISAVGTATQPVIFTSRDNVLGLNDDTSQGQWGGVVLMGRGVTTDCAAGTVGVGAANTCERNTEGSADLARYGGNDDTYNAGRMSYVQIRYSGFVLGANSELQALTTEAIGTGTVIDHIQSHNSSDDAAEFFGGELNVSYYIATGADDDSLDVDTGARANFQYAMLLPRPGRADTLMEIDSTGLETDIRRTRLRVVNFVGVQQQTSADNEANGRAATLFRGNSDVTLYNGLIIAPNNECIRLFNSGTTPVTLTARSVVLQCGATKYIDGGGSGAAAAFGAGTNNNSDTFTNTLTGAGLYFNGANENAVPPTDPTALSTFFIAGPAPYRIGAAWAENNQWYVGWTCNSATANFGATSTACSSLPTT